MPLRISSVIVTQVGPPEANPQRSDGQKEALLLERSDLQRQVFSVD